ncbi:MAG: tripartite tricarboxylate transporter TctB family protein, partial [Geminicoccaceae bacterium]
FLTLWGLYRPLKRSLAGTFARYSKSQRQPLALDGSFIFNLVIILLVTMALLMSLSWQDKAALVPQVAGFAALSMALAALFTEKGRCPSALAGTGPSHQFGMTVEDAVDSQSVTLTRRLMTRRAAIYFAWLIGFLALIAAIGMVPAVPLFIALFARLAGGETWRIAVLVALSTAAACWLIFHWLLAVQWPHSLLGYLIPAARNLTGLL